MNPLLAGALAVMLAGGAAAAGPAMAASGGDAQACRSEISQLRYKIAGEEGLKEGDHELLGGLTAEEAGEPQENWFGSPPEKDAMLEKLEEASKLAADGDAEGCRSMVDEVRTALDEGRSGGSGSGG